MMKRYRVYAAIALFWLLPVAMAGNSPDQIVRQATDEILPLLKKNHDLYEKDHAKLYAMVYERILPYFDFRAMSKLVLARHWRRATEDQRRRFTEAFRDLLVRTYATALLNYTNEEILFLPFHAKPGDKRVTVKTEVKRSGGGANIPLYYSFYYKNGEWKIYDVSIDGVSMVTNYRGVYAERIKKLGLDGLIADISAGEAQKRAPAST